MAPLPDQVIGHQKQCAQLLEDIAKDNVSHAYLFSGPKRVGKFTVARWFALQLLSEGLPAERKPEVRDQIERMIHPDFLSLDQLWIEERQEDWNVIAQTSNIRQEDRAKPPKARTDSIGIDEIRAIQERVHDTGASKYFCCLVRSVERMHVAAATAFLKVLEEPPPRVVFVLTTEAEAQLLPTVRSRARSIKFHPLHGEELAPLLTGVPTDDATFIAHLSQGAPGKALTLSSDPEALRREKQMHAHSTQFWRANSDCDRLGWVSDVLKEPERVTSMLLHLGLTLREQPAGMRKSRGTRAYANLVEALQTNAHKGLLLQRFVLALGRE